jgi:hypothetical protein
MVQGFPQQNESNGAVTFDIEHVEDDEQKDNQETASEGSDFSDVPVPPRSGRGGRTVSTQARLQRQGLRNSKSSVANFAVKSIRRGSDDWRGLSKYTV